MKKIITILAMVFICTIARAQWQIPLQPDQGGDFLKRAIETYDNEPSKENKKKLKMAIDLAVSLGVNFSMITGESESYKGFLPGAVLGVHSNFTRPDRKIVGDVGLLFSMEGGRYEDYEYEPGGNSSQTSASLRLNYLRVPITAKYRTNINKGFFAEAGLQPGLLLSAKDKRSGSSYDAKEGFNKFDFGVILGVGYQINHKFSAGLSVIPGITNINKSSGMDYYSVKDRNFGISLKAAYRIL
jgi:opacity protein-like surface antigen